jgi:hypothetical protein
MKKNENNYNKKAQILNRNVLNLYIKNVIFLYRL